MADVWFKKLGFGSNPFSIKPAAFSYELFGANIDGVLSGIEDGKVLFVEAPLGLGKTTLLKGIISRFGGRKRVIYAHAVPSQRIDVKELLKRSSLANFITGSLPSGMILVVDEAQNILRDSSAQILEFYRNSNIRAVVFFGTKYSGNGFVGELRAMMNGNLVRLSGPTPEQAVSIVRSRIGSLPLLSNEVILMAYRKAQGNPRRLLQICEDMCRAAVEEGKLSVSPSRILGVSPFAAAVVAETGMAAGAKLFARKKPRASIRKPLSIKKAGKSVVAAASAKKSSSSGSGKKAAAKGRKKSGLPKPLAKQSETANASDSSSESGHYWGEFMGMQK
ncbi:hypothetical protein HYU20_03535 [Candidatus Woesearchaeota archaeon]|nr:hypothetical protein [Candidatus Woesearchaeota archaeon]